MGAAALEFQVNLLTCSLEAINDINPSIKLGEEGINSVLVALEAVRERALSKSTILTLSKN